MKKVMIGTVKIDKDIEMVNTQFGYAASYERLLVKKGEYPIYAFDNDLKRNGDRVTLGWRNFVGFEGTVIAGNVGGKAGEATSYHQMTYDYLLADHFIDGHKYETGCTRFDYELRPEWGIELHDFISFDGKRVFTKGIYLKDETAITYSTN